MENYNGGPGCLGNAITRTWNEDQTINWMNVAANLDPVCQPASDYVIDISNGNTEKVPVFSTPLPTPTSTLSQDLLPTPTPNLTQSPTGTSSPTPNGIYPTGSSTPTIP